MRAKAPPGKPALPGSPQIRIGRIPPRGRYSWTPENVKTAMRWPPIDVKNMAAGLCVLIVIFAATPLPAQETENQFWPEVDVFVRLSGKTRFFLVGSATRNRDINAFSDGQLGGYLDFYVFPLFLGKDRRVGRRDKDESRTRSLMIGAGYLLDRTAPENRDRSIVHMPTIEAHMRMEAPGKILLSDRNRSDFRIVNGDYRPRYRNRIKGERPFTIGRVDLNPYSSFEVFYDWHSKRVDRLRYSAGMEWTLTRHVTLEGYYMRQHNRISGDRVNGIGAVVQWYFR